MEDGVYNGVFAGAAAPLSASPDSVALLAVAAKVELDEALVGPELADLLRSPEDLLKDDAELPSRLPGACWRVDDWPLCPNILCISWSNSWAPALWQHQRRRYPLPQIRPADCRPSW